MAQIFLCYVEPDLKKAEELHQRLSAEGFKPWMKDKDILPGKDKVYSIQKAIEHSDFFLAFLSPNSVTNRGSLQEEIKAALKKWQEKLEDDIYLIPILLGGCEVPDSLRRFQGVNPFEAYGWEQLVTAIRVGIKHREGEINPIDQGPEIPSPGDDEPRIIPLKIKIILTLDMELAHFDEGYQKLLRDRITSFLSILPQAVQVTSIEGGSVKVTIELSMESAEKLLLAYARRDPELFKCLEPLKLIDLRREDVHKAEAVGQGEPIQGHQDDVPLSPGQVLGGRYLIERELNGGGIGRIYLAHDKRLLSKPVVIKVLRKDAARDEWVRQKFLQEVEALARITHPGVVKVLDKGEHDGEPFFVMEFLKGESLRSVMRPEQGMDFGSMARFMREIGRALSAAHVEGIYHRDLKPENIMLEILTGGEQQAKLIDFGIAKIVNSQVGFSTSKPMVVGTFEYMSPEQLKSQPISQRTDIYALGVIAYEMVTGRLPFNPTSKQWPQRGIELLEMQKAGVKVKPGQLRPGLPQAAEKVILKALSFQPEDRYERASDFGELLAQTLTSDIELPPTKDSGQDADLELAHVLFMDLVGYSKLPIERRPPLLQMLNEIVRNTLAFRAAETAKQLISLPTGDGMALVFFGDPRAPVKCATEIARALQSYPQIQLRIGVHTGPVIRVEDINVQRNVAGGGVDLAERVMSCGDAGHILLSQTAADILRSLADWRDDIHYIGKHKVKHGLRVDLFNLYNNEIGNPKLPRLLSKRSVTFRIAIGCAMLLVLLVAVHFGLYRYSGESGVSGKPTIHITQVPPYDPIGGPNSSAVISGEASGVAPKGFRVVLYSLTTILREDTWYVQPYTEAPFTEIGQDGKWSAEIHGGKRYAALLVRPTFVPRSKTSRLPDIGGDVVDKVEVPGSQ